MVTSLWWLPSKLTLNFRGFDSFFSLLLETLLRPWDWIDELLELTGRKISIHYSWITYSRYSIITKNNSKDF